MKNQPAQPKFHIATVKAMMKKKGYTIGTVYQELQMWRRTSGGQYDVRFINDRHVITIEKKYRGGRDMRVLSRFLSSQGYRVSKCTRKEDMTIFLFDRNVKWAE